MEFELNTNIFFEENTSKNIFPKKLVSFDKRQEYFHQKWVSD